MKRLLQCLGLSAMLIIGLGGCATTWQFEATMGNWVGQGFYAFHAVYGPPDSVEIVGDNRIFKYKLKGLGDCTVYWTVGQEGNDCGLAARREGLQVGSILGALASECSRSIIVVGAPHTQLQ